MARPAAILVVDDTPLNIRLLEAVLTTEGYRVIGAGSGDEALARANDELPDLVLLDVVMPEMDGYEVCRKLRQGESTRFLPIVMITSFEEHARLRALEAGADDFVYRPIQQAELFARVRSLLRIKQYHDQIQEDAAELTRVNASLEARVQQQLQQLERLESLRRFLAPQVADALVSSAESRLLESHRREVAVVCCRLRSFMAFVEAAEPEVVIEVLNAVYGTLGDIVHRFEGTVGDFLEGGLMVFFNDPVPCEEPARQAARMAHAMRDQVQVPLGYWGRRGFKLDFAAGIDMGYATLGRIGFEGRYDYAAVGRVVSIAMRLSEQAGPGQIVVSGRISAEIEPLMSTRSLGEFALEGLPRPVTAHELVAAAAPAETTPASGELSAREQEVARLVALGRTNRQIAEELVISERTAETHLERIFGKLGLHARAQLAAWAIEHGLVSEQRGQHSV